MTVILVPKNGEDIQVNAWNWRPTLELLSSTELLSDEMYERMELNGCGGQADSDLAFKFAEVIEAKLKDMRPGERMRADLTITSIPKPENPETNDLYSVSYEWLCRFHDFCRKSGGFDVL